MKTKKIRVSLLLVLVVFWETSVFAATKTENLQKNYPINFSQVKITDNFWLPRLKMHATVTLPACINQCENATQRIKNFAIAAGMEKGEFKGFVYDDSDLYKMLEGASYSLMNNPNPRLEAKLDSIIAKIAKAQLPDGYLMTYFILGDISKRFTDMDKHETYCCGHLIEAGVAFYYATGKRSLLDVAIKYADFIDHTFCEGKRIWVPGHEEIELALVKLYRVTNDARYLKLSHWLLEQRGHNNGTWSADDKDYYQDLVPVKDLQKISGHAVRAMYLFTGMADITAATGDSMYIPTLDKLWKDVVNTKMYITGGIGSSKANEGFSGDYDLPNEDAYCETCASVGMVFWNQRMNMLIGDARYVDVLERSMYNGALAGTSISGDRFFYVNPLESDGKHHRKAWYGTACCPSQISRFLPSIGSYIYATSPDNSIWVNLFIGSETNVKRGQNNVTLKQETKYPWEGNVTLSVSPQKPEKFSLKLRLPGWCKKYTLKVNGTAVKPDVNAQYLVINRLWKKGDKITFNMDMPVEVVAADPRVKADEGKRAIQRGPLVYCLEEVDNPTIDTARLDTKATFTSLFEPTLLNGITTITAKSAGQTYKFIPYYAWDNRQAGKMKVWVNFK